MTNGAERPGAGRGLSSRLLALTVVFVLLGEVLIYIPSIARFRATFLEARLAAAHLASLSVDLGDRSTVTPQLEAALLSHAGVVSITLWRPFGQVMLGRKTSVDQVYDLREAGAWRMIVDSLATLAGPGTRTIRVIGPSPYYPATMVDIVLPEAPLRAAMLDYSWRILALSIVLSLIVALAIFLSLRRMIVMPLARLSAAVQRFRDQPEDAAGDLQPSRRRDEIGIVERELAQMQVRVRQALLQKTRLAALGAAVSRIHHDLRNILASGVLLSERLDASADPAVRKIAPRLIDALERAARLCADTLSFARSRPTPARPRRFALHGLVADVLETATPPGVDQRNLVPPALVLEADPDQLYRVLLNLVRNAREALVGRGGSIAVAAEAGPDGVRITVADDAGGLPRVVREHLFEPFSTTGKLDGTGLGLAIARELMRAQGGDISLLATSADGTTFMLQLPARCVAPAEREMAA